MSEVTDGMREMRDLEADLPNTRNRSGIIGLVLGVLSISFMWVPFAGMVLGVFSMVMASHQQKSFPNIIAVGGAIIGAMGFIINGLFTYFWFLEPSMFYGLPVFGILS